MRLRPFVVRPSTRLRTGLSNRARTRSGQCPGSRRQARPQRLIAPRRQRPQAGRRDALRLQPALHLGEECAAGATGLPTLGVGAEGRQHRLRRHGCLVAGVGGEVGCGQANVEAGGALAQARFHLGGVAVEEIGREGFRRQMAGGAIGVEAGDSRPFARLGGLPGAGRGELQGRRRQAAGGVAAGLGRGRPQFGGQGGEQALPGEGGGAEQFGAGRGSREAIYRLPQAGGFLAQGEGGLPAAVVVAGEGEAGEGIAAGGAGGAALAAQVQG